MSYDLSNVEAIDGILKGEFTGRIDEASIKQSKSGHDMLNFKVCLIEAKRHVYCNFMLQGNGALIGMGKIKHLCDLHNLPTTIDKDCSMWKGRMFKVVVGPQKNDNSRTEIKSWSKLDTSFDTENF